MPIEAAVQKPADPARMLAVSGAEPSQPPAKESVSTVAPAEPAFDEVAREAYRLYLDRGGEDGHDVDDWLAAEGLLRARATERT